MNSGKRLKAIENMATGCAGKPCHTLKPSHSGKPCHKRRRRGAILSMELVLVLPLVIGLFFALIEFSMLWSASHLVQEASVAGCRTATFHGSNAAAIQRSVELALGKIALVQNCQVQVQGGLCSGDDVIVTVTVPMNAAAPDLLGMLGFSLAGQSITAQTVMRKE
jgi:hypothetical protein